METNLIEAGLNKNEAKIYLDLTEAGTSSIGEVSKRIKVHRSNVYDAVEGLVTKGLVSFVVKNKVKQFQITHPNNLLNMIREKEEKVQQLLPQLTLMNSLSDNKNEAQIMEGLPAAKRAMDHFLTHNETINVMGVPSKVAELVGPFLTNYHKRRTAKKIVMRHIYNTDANERMRILEKMPYTEVKILPAAFNSPVATNIVGNEVTLIYWDKNATVIRIVNEKIASVYKQYFNLLWNKAKKP